MNLHTAYERAAANVKKGPIAGVVKPRGVKGPAGPTTTTSPTATTGPTLKSGTATGSTSTSSIINCTEPNCDLTYNGGPVQHSPKIYVDFWGPKWTTDTGSEASTSYLLKFYQGLGSAQDKWSAVTSQYADGSGGAPAFTGPVFAEAVNDTSPPPTQVSESDIGAEAAAAASTIGISDVADAQVVVATQSGTCLAVETPQGTAGFAGDSSTCPTLATPAGYYCGWHSDTAYNGGDLSFTSLPYQPDGGYSCGQNFVNSGSASYYDGFSIVGGHEYAESVTDPVPPSSFQSGAWVDLFDGSGGEIADKCAWSDPDGDVTLSTGTFAMQSLWSNADGRCVMAPPTTTSLTGSLSGGGQTGKSIWVTSGTAVSASVTLSGTNASQASGSVDYYVYSNPACTTLVTSTGPEAITTAGELPVGQQDFTEPGTYYWKAAYSGDGYNKPSKTACGTGGLVEAVMVAAPAPPRRTGTQSWRPSSPRCWENC